MYVRKSLPHPYIYILSLFAIRGCVQPDICQTFVGGNLHREILTMEELPPLLDIKLPESYLYHPKFNGLV